MPLSRDDAERVFLARVKVIERLTRRQAWRYHLSPETTDDVVSEVMMKFIEHDYERLRKVRGESSLEGFLVTAVTRLVMDLVAMRWGKWRTSPAALRLGEVAIQLELLIGREGQTFDAACEALWNRGCKHSRQELEAFAAQLPIRTPRRFESVESALELPSHDEPPDALLAREEAARTAARAQAVLTTTLSSWATEDRLLFIWRYRDGARMATIARALGKPTHPLYNRAERLLAMLRTAFEAAGLDGRAVLEMLKYLSPDFRWNPEES